MSKYIISEVEIQKLAQELSTENESLLRKRLFELRKEGIDLHDLASMFIVGPDECQNPAVGYYIVTKMLKNELAKYEEIYCLFTGRGKAKNRPKAFRMTQEPDFREPSSDVLLFKSEFTLGIPWSELTNDRFWKEQQNGVEKRNRREEKFQKFSTILNICFVIIPSLLILAFPYFLYINWNGCLGEEIPSCSLYALSFLSIILIGRHFMVKRNDIGLSAIESIGYSLKTLEKIGRGKKKPRHIPVGFWIIALILYIMGGMTMIPLFKSICCILYPGITLIIWGLYLFLYLPMANIYTDIAHMMQRDPSFVEDAEYGRGTAVGAAFLSFMTIAGSVIGTIIWAFIVIKNFSYFFG